MLAILEVSEVKFLLELSSNIFVQVYTVQLNCF